MKQSSTMSNTPTIPHADPKVNEDLAAVFSFGDPDRIERGKQVVHTIVDKLETREIDILDDVQITQEKDEKGRISYRYFLGGSEVNEDLHSRFSNSLFAHLGVSRTNLDWIDYTDMVGRKLKANPKMRRKLNLTVLNGVDLRGEETDQMTVFAAIPGFPPNIKSILKILDPDVMVMSPNGHLMLAAHPTFEKELSILGDTYHMHNFLRAPLDGYGNTRRVLGNIRAVCTNGMVLFGEKYVAKLKNGADLTSDMYSNLRSVSDEHVRTLHGRLNAAAITPMSALEFKSLMVCMFADRKQYTERRREELDATRQTERFAENERWFSLMEKLGGNILPDGVDWSRVFNSETELLAPVKCRTSVLDAINMMTEIATHHFDSQTGVSGKEQFSNALGELMSKRRFNLEGVKIESQNRAFWFN